MTLEVGQGGVLVIEADSAPVSSVRSISCQTNSNFLLISSGVTVKFPPLSLDADTRDKSSEATDIFSPSSCFLTRCWVVLTTVSSSSRPRGRGCLSLTHRDGEDHTLLPISPQLPA